MPLIIPSDKVMETDSAWVWLGKDGVLYEQVRGPIWGTEQHTIDNNRAFIEIAAGTPRPLVADLTGLTWIPLRAAAHMRDPALIESLSAVAMLPRSIPRAAMGRLFAFMAKTPFPIRVFKRDADAIAWARTFV